MLSKIVTKHLIENLGQVEYPQQNTSAPPPITTYIYQRKKSEFKILHSLMTSKSL